MFNATVSFTDDEPDMFVPEVTETELGSLFKHLGVNEARVRIQPSPGFHYFTAASRIKHITATLIEETSN
jgi:hypothetical protein